MSTLVLTLTLAAACGGDGETQSSTGGGDALGSSGGEQAGRPDDGLQVEGLMGSLSDVEVHRGLDPRMPRFLSCFERRYDAIEYLAGSISLSFRVATDGSVRWVYPRASNVGDRDTERCILDVAASTRFSRPQGGEAEFRFPFEVETLDDVRPPFNWDAEQVADAVGENAGDVRSCGGGPYLITAYVAPGGTVVSAGASTTDEASADKLDCVADAVRQWGMPDPGSYPAKVTFQVD